MINTDILMVNTEMIFVEKFYRLHFQRTFRIWRCFTFSTASTAVQATIISHRDLCICLLIDLPLHPSPTCWPPCISWVCRAILLPWGPGPCYLFSLKWPSLRATWFASLLSCRHTTVIYPTKFALVISFQIADRHLPIGRSHSSNSVLPFFHKNFIFVYTI